MNRFQRLLSPIQLGSQTIQNRVVLGSMHSGLEDKEEDFHKLAAYLAERARGDVGLIVTGGVAPNNSGRVAPFAGKLNTRQEVGRHRLVTDAVHNGTHTKILMQILHSGRYGYHPFAVAPSAIKSPISPWFNYTRGLSLRQINSQIEDFVTCAKLAQEAGYDGVEVMGSEGYLINEFLSSRTNKRTDEFGGSYENRTRFPTEIVRRVREAVGKDFIIMYRISLLDLVSDGQTFSEIALLAKKIEDAGATILNTGIGWHEARIPTIATMVPFGAFGFASKRLKSVTKLPVVVSNRINTPERAEEILNETGCDMVSMARPLLADPNFVKKTMQGKTDQINVCIACNQSCLDHVFQKKRASCLVNPRACYETERPLVKAQQSKRVLVIGGGPAGLAAASTLAERGHTVSLFEANVDVGGQFALAQNIPGKEDFSLSLSYFKKQLEIHKVEVRLSYRAVPRDIVDSNAFDAIIVATGVKPRRVDFSGAKEAYLSGEFLAYDDAIRILRNEPQKIGKDVAIIGGGGIAFDVAEMLLHDTHASSKESIEDARKRYYETWGIDTTLEQRGGLMPASPAAARAPHRNLTMFQRKSGKFGLSLGNTTGWIHRQLLANAKVKMISDAQYESYSNHTLNVKSGDKSISLRFENVIVCAGQESVNRLAEEIKSILSSSKSTSLNAENIHVIGGALLASEIDAARAIREAIAIADKI